MYDFKTYEYGNAVKGVVFIFGAWRMSRIIYRQGIKKMNKAGYKCILYAPSTKLLAVGTPHMEIVNASKKAVELVEAYIKNDTTRNAKYITMGVSFGTAFALKVTKECPAVSAVILLSPFGDFGEHMKIWLQHRYFGKLERSQPVGVDESVGILNKLSTSLNLESLKGKVVLIGYGLNDTLIHTSVTEKFIAKLIKNDVNVITKSTTGGHFISMYKLSLWFQPNNINFFK